MSEKYIEEMIETRRALHKRPELGWTEFETMWHICSHLEQWGIPYVLGTQVINPAFVMGRNETEVKDAMERAKKTWCTGSVSSKNRRLYGGGRHH